MPYDNPLLEKIIEIRITRLSKIRFGTLLYSGEILSKKLTASSIFRLGS